MSDPYLDKEREFWEDNDVGIRKKDFDDEDDYMDAVRERWPDNSVGVFKDDYDTKEDYLEAVREEREDDDLFGTHGFDYTPPRKHDPYKAWTDKEVELELRRIRREMEMEREKKWKKRREGFDMFFPEFKNVPIVWLVIGLICVLISLFSLIL